jgi:hypothetical protein
MQSGSTSPCAASSSRLKPRSAHAGTSLTAWTSTETVAGALGSDASRALQEKLSGPFAFGSGKYRSLPPITNAEPRRAADVIE